MNVMERAWEIAKRGASRFGGKASEYLSEALKQSWAEKKAVVPPEDIPASVGWREGQSLGILTRPQESGMFWVANTVGAGKGFDFIFPRADWRAWSDGGDVTAINAILIIMDSASEKGPVSYNTEKGQLVYDDFADEYNLYAEEEAEYADAGEEAVNPFDVDDGGNTWGWLTR